MDLYNEQQPNFFELKNQIITNINVGDATSFETAPSPAFPKGRKYTISHYQDCCEQVRLTNVIINGKNHFIEGNDSYVMFDEVQNILHNTPITLAETDNSEPKFAENRAYDDSHTWSAFFFETKLGRVELWFLGESNGYYSESMGFNGEDI